MYFLKIPKQKQTHKHESNAAQLKTKTKMCAFYKFL